MSYQEPNFDLCKTCYIREHNPSKKSIKKLVLTTYTGPCQCCGKVTRLVEYTWEEGKEND